MTGHASERELHVRRSPGSPEMGEENDLRLGVNQMAECGDRANQSDLVQNPPVIVQRRVEVHAYHDETPGDGLGGVVLKGFLVHPVGRERPAIDRRYEGRKLLSGPRRHNLRLRIHERHEFTAPPRKTSAIAPPACDPSRRVRPNRAASR